MNFLHKILALATLVVALIMAMLVAANLDSIRVIGWHFERFVAESLALALRCMIGAALLAALSVLVVLALQIVRRRNENLRQRDGSFPLQRIRVGAATVIIDPNKTVAPALVVSPGGIAEIFTAAPQLHLSHAVERARVAQMQALAPGDAAISTRYGSMYEPRALMNAATGKLLSGGWSAKPMQDIPDEWNEPDDAKPVAAPLTLADAVQQAGRERLLIGQSDAGHFAIYNPALHGHAAIVGSTGTGKTTGAAFTAALSALAAGYQLLILDPESGADWSVFQSHATVHESDRSVFGEQIAALTQEYARRGDGAQNAMPLLIIIEEYGDLIRQLRSIRRRDAENVDVQLDLLLRRGRKRGVHLLLVDQYPEHWSQQVIAGVKFRAVFQLGPNQGARMEEYHASKLPGRGVFLHDGERYNAWHAQPQVRQLLATISPPPPFVLDAVRRSSSGEGTADNANERSCERRDEHSTNAPTLADDDDASRWQPLIDAWFAEHPAALSGPAVGISDIARRMALAATGDAANYERYKSTAHQLYHEFRRSVRLPSGDKLGADVSRPVNGEKL